MKYLIFGDKSVGVLSFHIWIQFLKTVEDKFSFQTFKRSLSDWFGPNFKCTVIWTITVITRVSARGAHLFWILKREALIPGRRSFEEGDH